MRARLVDFPIAFASRHDLELREGFRERWFQWRISVGRCIELNHSVKFPTESNKWLAGVRYFALCFHLRGWKLGYFHAYYDGDHHSFSVGPLHLCWGC